MHDRSNSISLASHPDWATKCQQAISTQAPVPFSGSFGAKWDNGSIGNFTVNFNGTITPTPGGTSAVWTGTIWFADRFEFPPTPDWSPQNNGGRDMYGEDNHAYRVHP